MTGQSVIFASARNVALGGAEIAELKRLAAGAPERRARYCLHQDHGDPVQEMVIALCRDTRIEPHRQVGKCKTYYVVEGELVVRFFDAAVRPTHTVELSAPGGAAPFAYRFDAEPWHTVRAASDFVIYVETVVGPFDPAHTDWAGEAVVTVSAGP